MRAILFSAVCLLASFASTTPVVQYQNKYAFLDDTTKGQIIFQYTIDAGYNANTGYSVNGDDKSVTASATAGIYSQVDLEFLINLYGIFELNLKIATVPITFNPFSASAQWTHPLALAQGQEMSGLINAGYDFNLGDIQFYYYVNHLFPKVSVIDYILGANSYIIPGDITTATYTGTQTAAPNTVLPDGFDYNVDHNNAYIADPVLNFNLGKWLIDNTDFTF